MSDAKVEFERMLQEVADMRLSDPEGAKHRRNLGFAKISEMVAPENSGPSGQSNQEGQGRAARVA